MIEKQRKISPAGFVPIDWEIKTLHKVATVEYGISDPLNKNLKEGVRIIGLPNVSKDGIFNPEPHYFVSPEKFSPKVKLRSGDILFNWRSGSREHLGKTYFFNFDGDFTHVGFLLRIRKLNETIVPRYLDAYMKFIKQRGYFLKAKIQVNSTFNKGELLELPVVLPPLPEQRVIAEILSTWDKAIALTEKLIEALKERKKGLMQRLLTGEVRFPGFEGEWMKIQLSAVSKKIKGKVVNTNEENIGLPYIGSTSFNGSFSLFSNDDSGIRCHSKDVLILWDGEYAGKTTTGLDGYASSTVVVLRLNEDRVNNYFINAYLTHINSALRKISEGSGIPHMPGDLLDWIKLPVPCLKEQGKIADLLQACDSEINLHNQKLAALQQQKKGLMQRLLSGKVRVKV